MAADTRFGDDCDAGNIRKLFRFHGVIYGLAGEVAAWDGIKAWLRTGGQNRKPPGDWSILAMAPRRIRTFDTLNGWIELDEKMYAIGTGGAAARGAMMAGAPVLKAVRYAISIDPNSGGGVRYMRLPAQS